MLVVDRRCRAREIVDLVDLHIERKGDIVPNHFEMLVIAQVLDIAPCAGEEIINAHHHRAVRNRRSHR